MCSPPHNAKWSYMNGANDNVVAIAQMETAIVILFAAWRLYAIREPTANHMAFVFVIHKWDST